MNFGVTDEHLLLLMSQNQTQHLPAHCVRNLFYPGSLIIVTHELSVSLC